TSRRRSPSSPSPSPGRAWPSSTSSVVAPGAPRRPRARGRHMAFLEIVGLRKSFGTSVGVENFDLAVERGEFISFLGPSGGGKTTTLRMVAGFEQPTAGSIRINGEDVTGKRPNQRNVGMVFQAYALFPNMTIAENVGFGLKVAKRPTEEIH